MPFDGPPVISERVGLRVATRLGLSFYLQHLQIVRDQRPVIDGLILLALFQANYARLRGDQICAAIEGEPVAGPTPASVNALAQSLKLPYETVRKRVALLRADDLCAHSKGALLITPVHLQSERFQWRLHTVWSEVRKLYFDLADLGVLKPMPDGPVCASPPLFDVLRLAGDYSLRSVETMSNVMPNPTHAVLFVHINRANTEHLDNTFTEVSEPDVTVRDELRRPASIPLLASRAGLTVETARRHVAALVEQGWVVRAPEGGVWVSSEMLLAAPWPEARRQNLANLNRLVEGLNTVGALAFWQR